MSGHELLTWQDKVLLFFAVLLIVLLLIIVLLFFCRHRLAKWCPCLVVKIKPEERTGWHHLDRFGEVKLKTASYSVKELRARGQGADSVEEGSVQTNVSLQVPVFEEKLNATVTKKSVHVASTDFTPAEPPETPQRRKKTKKKKKKEKQADRTSSADIANDLELAAQDSDSPVHRHHYGDESV
ncbi:uncharacterized protein LOC143277630 [Babylonia areolata]|uniref:uncharacterized protein LOC143277630 n=1 Tax=Babylonia areolata TaxID=304850 RepID=UPI003FCFB0A8